MKCFSEGCTETPELVCYCNGEILICKAHFDDHITLSGFTHNVKALKNTPDPALKKYYIENLKTRVKFLEKSSNSLIENIYKQIENLESYLESSLEKIEKEKKVLNDLIAEIISIEKIQRDAVDDTGAIFTLQKKAGNKKLKEYIQQRSGQQPFDFGWIKFFIDQSKTLQKIKVGKLTENNNKIDLPEPVSSKIGMCALPDKKTFFYGNYVQETTACSGITFAISNNEKFEMLTAGIPCISSGLVYCDGFVYSFGGKNNENLNICQKYDLKENTWIQLASLIKPSSCCSCDLFGKYIVYSGIGIGVNAYNISLNSHAQVLSLSDQTSKLVFNSGKRIIVVENGGKIYESAIFNINSWSCIGNSLTPNWETIGHKILYNNFVIFTLLGSELQIYQFNIETASISQLKTIKVNAKIEEEEKKELQDKEKTIREENKEEKTEQIKVEIKEETKELPKQQIIDKPAENKQKTKNPAPKKEATNKKAKKQKKEKQDKNKKNLPEKAQKAYKKKEIQTQAKIKDQKPQEELKTNENPIGNPSEPKYKKKEVQEFSRRSSFSSQQTETEELRKENEIYVSGKGSKKNYIEEALTLLSKEDIREVILKGSNMAIYNVVCTAEVVKRLVGGLFQINELYNSTPEKETIEGIKKNERITVSIRLSKDPLDSTHYGYQQPICKDTTALLDNPSDVLSNRPRNQIKLPSFYAQSDVKKFQNWKDL